MALILRSLPYRSPRLYHCFSTHTFLFWPLFFGAFNDRRHHVDVTRLVTFFPVDFLHVAGSCLLDTLSDKESPWLQFITFPSPSGLASTADHGLRSLTADRSQCLCLSPFRVFFPPFEKAGGKHPTPGPDALPRPFPTTDVPFLHFPLAFGFKLYKKTRYLTIIMTYLHIDCTFFYSLTVQSLVSLRHDHTYSHI